MITPSEIVRMRLQNQQISYSRFQSSGTLVRYMGAMQAQHYNMVKYATGLRIPGSAKTQVEQALNKGKIIRTHALRPTWHIVAAEDLTPILQLTAPRILASMKTRHRQLGLTSVILQKSFNVFKRSLKDHPGKRRDELLLELQKAGIKMQGNNAAAHILMAAELNQIICSGKEDGKQNTYALYNSRVPGSSDLNREHLICWLAEKYFTSHGPATVEDFSWWSGLTLTEARNGVAMISPKIESVTLHERRYWYRKGTDRLPPCEEKAYLIPAFDEFVVSYKTKDLVFQTQDKKKAISSNGIFWPFILINGEATGLWKLVEKKKLLHIEARPFRRHSATERLLIKEAALQVGAFYNKKIELCF